MEEQAKRTEDRKGLHGIEAEEWAKNDPEFSKQLEAAKKIMEEYSETLQRLADS